MKKIFKLAAIAVSMALVTSLIACSSGDDDVVDATTPEYLLNDQIGKYVASIKYEQNVSDDEIKSLKTEHENMMKFIDGCADCLNQYFSTLKGKLSNYVDGVERLGSVGIENCKKELKGLKEYYGTKELYHEVYIYKPAIGKALANAEKDGTARKEVDKIGDPEGDTTDTILNGKLNERQAGNMKAYTDAFAALTATLNETDSKSYKTKVEAANKVIEDFYNLNKDVDEKSKGKVNKTEIAKVTAVVDTMCADIRTNVYENLSKLVKK